MTSTIDPTVPATNAALLSAPIRANFLAAYNDINGIQTVLAGLGNLSTQSQNNVTITGGNIAGSALNAGTVANTALAAMANNTVKGNVSGSTASPTDLTQTQLTNLISTFSSTIAGKVPASGGGTTNFLRADGTWTTPATSGGVLSLNGLSGTLNLTSSDSSVTITPSGGSINLQVTGGGGLTAIGPYSVLANNTASTAIPTGQQTLNLGVLGLTDTGIIESLASSTAGYNQAIIQNTNSGATSSANFVAANDQGTATTNYIEMGINSSGFTGTGSFNIAGAGYIDSANDLTVGTLNSNPIHFVTNSSAIDAMTISAAGTTTITGSSASQFAVGQNGATNPAFAVDTSTASSITGISVKSAAAGSGVLISATSTGTTEELQLASKGSAAVRIQPGGSIRATFSTINTIFNPSSNTGAGNVRFSFIAAADTILTSATEGIIEYFNNGVTRQWTTGALTLQRDYRITPGTIAFVGASTVTDSAAFSVDGPHKAGTNATITNAHGIYVPSATLTGTIANANSATFFAPTGASGNNWALNLNGTMGIDGSNNIIGAGTIASGSHTITGTETITSSSATAFSVGQAGQTNPAFQVDASTTSSVSGIVVKSNATGAATTITATDGGANAPLTIATKGSGQLVLSAGTSGSISIAPAGSQHLFMNINQTQFTTTASSVAANVRWSFTGAADLTLTSATEATSTFFNLGQVRQHATGNIALQRDFRIAGSTHSAVAASTITEAAAFSVDAGDAGTNMTITNLIAIRCNPYTYAGTVTNAYGAVFNAPVGAGNNYAAQFVGGAIRIAPTAAPTGQTGGEIWVDSTQKALTMNIAGNVLYNRALLFAQTAAGSVTGTTAASLWGTGTGTRTIAANTLTIGKTVTILAGGTLATAITVGNVTIAIKLGSVTIATATLSNVQNSLTSSTGAFQLNMMITTQSIGGTGTVVCNGNINYTTALLTRGFAALNNAGAASTIDTTSAQAVDIIITWANTGNTITQTTGTVEISG